MGGKHDGGQAPHLSADWCGATFRRVTVADMESVARQPGRREGDHLFKALAGLQSGAFPEGERA